jgi:hypothetical protein
VPTEIVVEAEDRPGMVAALGELFGQAGVNLTAAAAFTHDGRGFLHLVVEEADRALKALREGDWQVVGVQEVMSISLDDRPGELGRFARRLADSGINITSLYIAGARGGDKEIVVAVDDLHKARHLPSS